MSIAQPYLLFLGDVTDPISAKTARGIALWRPELCVGELKLTTDTVSLGLEDLTLEKAIEKGARTLVIGTANAGGIIPETWKPTLIKAAQLGLGIASGMHSRLTRDPRACRASSQRKDATSRCTSLRCTSCCWYGQSSPRQTPSHRGNGLFSRQNVYRSGFRKSVNGSQSRCAI